MSKIGTSSNGRGFNWSQNSAMMRISFDAVQNTNDFPFFLSLLHCPSMDEMYNMLSENYFVIILTLGFVLLSDKKIIRQ